MVMVMVVDGGDTHFGTFLQVLLVCTLNTESSWTLVDCAYACERSKSGLA